MSKRLKGGTMNYKLFLLRFLFVGIFVFLLKVMYHLAIWVVFTDISMEPIDKQACVEINSSEFKPRLPVTLISYADGHEIFYKNQNFQVFSGLNKGIDQFILYKRNMIDPEFYKKNAHILQEKFGVGYWLWKPQIILQTMKMMPENSIIIYMDSGLSVKNTLQPIFDVIKQHDIIIAEDGEKAQKPYLDMMVDKNTIQKIGIDLKQGEHIKPLWAAFLVVKNTEKARKFIETWLSFCEQKELITQYLNDQMILGLLGHKYSQSVYTMPEPTVTNMLEWHHRKTTPADLKLSLLTSLHKHVGGSQGKLLNSKIFHMFRDFALTHLTNIQSRLRKAAVLKLKTN